MTAGPRVTLQQSNRLARSRSGINRKGHKQHKCNFSTDHGMGPRLPLHFRSIDFISDPSSEEESTTGWGQILDTDEVPQRHTLRTQLTQWCLQSLSNAQDFSNMKHLT